MVNQTSEVTVASFGEAAAAVAPKDIATLRKLATDALNQHEKAVKAYFALCVHIREKQIAPDVVTIELKARGFADSRISEVKRVAFCAPALFEQFLNGVVGFRYALQAARQGDSEKGEQTTLPGVEPLKPEVRLRRDLEDALASVIPLKGGLPKLLRYQVRCEVNGYEVVVRVKKRKAQK